MRLGRPVGISGRHCRTGFVVGDWREEWRKWGFAMNWILSESRDKSYHWASWWIWSRRQEVRSKPWLVKKQWPLVLTSKEGCLILFVGGRMFVFLSVFRHDYRAILFSFLDHCGFRVSLCNTGILWHCFWSTAEHQDPAVDARLAPSCHGCFSLLQPHPRGDLVSCHLNPQRVCFRWLITIHSPRWFQGDKSPQRPMPFKD